MGRARVALGLSGLRRIAARSSPHGRGAIRTTRSDDRPRAVTDGGDDPIAWTTPAGAREPDAGEETPNGRSRARSYATNATARVGGHVTRAEGILVILSNYMSTRKIRYGFSMWTCACSPRSIAATRDKHQRFSVNQAPPLINRYCLLKPVPPAQSDYMPRLQCTCSHVQEAKTSQSCGSYVPGRLWDNPWAHGSWRTKAVYSRKTLATPNMLSFCLRTPKGRSDRTVYLTIRTTHTR